MDGVLWYCKEHSIMSTVKKYHIKILKRKIKLEATNLKMLKYQKCGRLSMIEKIIRRNKRIKK